MGRPWNFNFHPQGLDPWTLPRPGAETREAGAVLEDARPGRVEEAGSSAAAELLSHGAGGATTAVAIRGGAIDAADVYSNKGPENMASVPQTPATTDEAPVA